MVDFLRRNQRSHTRHHPACCWHLPAIHKGNLWMIVLGVLWMAMVLHFQQDQQEDIRLDEALASHHPAVARGRALPTKSYELTNNVTIDIVIIASDTRPHYLQTQKETWTRHVSVRNIRSFSESSFGQEQTCLQQLNASVSAMQANNQNCKRHNLNHPSGFMKQFRFAQSSWRWLKQKANPAGWVCAQRRWGYALGAMGDEYRTSSLPDFLLVVDDDTFINIPLVLQYMNETTTAASIPRVVAACLCYLPVCEMTSNKQHVCYESNFTSPQGGLGTMFNRAAMERFFLEPFLCQKDPRSPSRTVCTNGADKAVHTAHWQTSRIGEASLRVDGMSRSQPKQFWTISDVMREYSSSYDPFCLHSDWMVGYFVQYYVLANSNHHLEAYQTKSVSGSREPSVHRVAASTGNCRSTSDDQCDGLVSAACHYVTPNGMRNWTNQLRYRYPNDFLPH